MPERFDVYRFTVDRPEGGRETRYSLAPMKGVRFAGRDEPLGAEPQDNGPEETGQHLPAGIIEAPDGTTVWTTDPPVLDIPGRGRVDLHAVIGATNGKADELGHLLRLRAHRLR